jgi:hypothetical protein
MGDMGLNQSEKYETGSEEYYNSEGKYNPFHEHLTYTGMLNDFNGFHRLNDDAPYDPKNNARNLSWFAESNKDSG